MPSRDSSLPLPLSLIATAMGVGVYALAVVWSSRHPSGWSLALAALPFVWLAAAYARGAFQPKLMAPARFGRLWPLLAALTVLGFAWEPLLSNVRLLYLAQHVGVHGALCWLFARTLAAGKTPLCTEFASWVHEDMSSPRLLWYTRLVTQTWALFLGLMALASVILFGFARPDTWTAFSAVVGPILTAAVFLIENLLRSHFLPPRDRVGLAGTWRAVRARIHAQSPQRAR